MEHQSSARERFPRRAASAAKTRVALIRAAGELFVERGYLATTVVDIATRAGVGRATVFTSVPGGKPELLRLARDLALAGDDEAIPVPERSWFREAMAAQDPQRLLRLQARNYRMILQRAAALEQALVVGAASAPELAELQAQARTQRAYGARMVAQRLAELTALHTREVDHTADIIYALAAPSTFLLLTGDRGWSADRYEQWLAATLIAAIVG